MQNSYVKNSIVIIGAVILIWAGYVTFFKKDATANSNTSLITEAALAGDSPQAQSGREILTLLLNLKSLKLDASIFSDPSFQSLADFGQSIPVRPHGRGNPFAPIGTANTKTSVSTKTPF